MSVSADVRFAQTAPAQHDARSPMADRRRTPRAAVRLPARLTWKDRNGAMRFASVVTRDLSELGTFVECQSPIALSLFRLVYVQIDTDHRRLESLPSCLNQGRALAAVYRVQHRPGSGLAQGFALRLLVEPKRIAGGAASSRATA